MSACPKCSHQHSVDLGGICVGCACDWTPQIRYGCCKCCEGSAVCAALPDWHEFSCGAVDQFNRYTCDSAPIVVAAS